MNQKNDVIMDFENAYNFGEDYSEQLYSLAYFVTFSTVKKIYEKTGADEYRIYRREAMEGINTLKKIGYTSDISESIEYDKDGNAYTNISDKEEANNFNDIIHHEYLQDGFEIINHACMLILEECEKQKKRFEKYGSKHIDLLAPYIAKKLDKHVVIRSTDSPAVKEYETTPLRNIFINLRRYLRTLETNKSELNNEYAYFNVELTGEEYEDVEDKSLYYRVDKYSTFIDVETDINGKETVLTVDENGYKSSEITIKELTDSLSPTQKSILRYRLKGYGYKAIATRLNRSTQTVKDQLARIRKKAVEMGINADNV